MKYACAYKLHSEEKSQKSHRNTLPDQAEDGLSPSQSHLETQLHITLIAFVLQLAQKPTAHGSSCQLLQPVLPTFLHVTGPQNTFGKCSTVMFCGFVCLVSSGWRDLHR
ncbi:hypothetical protein AOLI_G00289360 [Acnodon oligacanthus]